MKIKNFVIDVKQPPDFISTLKNIFNEAVVMNLGENSGDLMIQLESKLVVIEVKVVPGDFIQSIVDRRLFNQSEGIRQLSPWSFLLLSTDFKYNDQHQVMGMSATGYGPMGVPGREWNRDHIDGALTAVQARGVIVRTAYNGYINAIQRILNWVEGADNGAVTSEVIKLSPFDTDDQKTVNLLAWFDGIGVIQAKNFMKWCKDRGILERGEIFWAATNPFELNDKPDGWTNNTIERNRKQLGLAPLKPKKEEWIEEIDLA